MKTNRIASLVVAASLTVITGYAQTAAERMQKGIYTQETAGDLDGAIAIYRQIVNSGNSPRDIAAQAQYRLAQSLLQKGDLSNASQEFEKLARNYADYGKLVGSLASTAQGTTTVTGRGSTVTLSIPLQMNGGRGGRGGVPPADANLTPEQQQAADQAKFAIALARLTELQKAGALPNGGGGGRGPGTGLFESMSFDAASPVTVKGVIFRTDFMNPTVAIFVDPQDGTGKRYAFAVASPREMNAQGWARDNAKPGDQLTITGVLAAGGQTLPNGTIAASATTITAADGRKLFDRSAIQK